MFARIKDTFPELYKTYKHVQRVSEKKQSQRFKKLTTEEMKKRISKTYRTRIGHELDWSNLRTYTELLQWEKIYNNDPRKAVLADKYKVREWVANQIGQEYLIPLLGVWNTFDAIDFDTLPNQFVLKTNHGSGTNYIVKDKTALDYKDAKSKFNDWLATDYGYLDGFELHYSDIKPLIIAEKYMETSIGELQDYKFLCFGGKAHYCWVDLGRFAQHTRTVFDMDWRLQPWTQAEYGISKEPIPRPQNFDIMIQLAENLAKDFEQVRVDFYNDDGKIYFGEMTFTNGKGFDPIVPDVYDLELGKIWQSVKKQ